MKKLPKERREDYYADETGYYDGFLTDMSSHCADIMADIQENLDAETTPIISSLKKALKQSKELSALIEDAIAALKEHEG